jgi:hypothetical protein
VTKERKISPVFILDEMHMAKEAFLQDLAIFSMAESLNLDVIVEV